MQTDTSHDAQAASTIATIEQFHEAINGRDVDAVMAIMTEDCVFESTYPPPDGMRYEGQTAVRGAFEEFYRDSPAASFDIEEMFAGGDRATVRWLYHWTDQSGKDGYIRGVDVIRVRDGKVAESLAYVKG